MNEVTLSETANRKRFGCLHVIGIILVVIVVTALLTAWWVKTNLYASEFRPVELNEKDQQVLDSKMELVRSASETEPQRAPGALTTTPYSEQGATREVTFSEKELNALLARDPEFAKRVAIDLSDDLVSIEIVMPMDQEVPLVGGKTLRLTMGVTLAYQQGKPVVIMRGISLGGIPLPSAWWGDIKNKNLVEEFNQDGGFWDIFSEGVADLRVTDGQFVLKLKE